MSISPQVLYPTDNGTTSNHDYYVDTDMDIAGRELGPDIDKTLMVKGLVGGPDTVAGYHAIATLTFADQAALDAATDAAGPALEDIPNFFSDAPQILIGAAVG
jgi:hypothetical protein